MAMRGLFRPISGLGRAARHSPLGRRLVLLQLDGVSRSRLERAMAEGYMPFLADRILSGSHVLAASRSGAPASTPAFQAGLFYGVSPSVPGFVWFDRATGREVRMDRPDDVAPIERRLSRAAPGLLRGGTSYFSIFSGGAALPRFCLSGLAGDVDLESHAGSLNVRDALASALAHSLTAARGALRLVNDLGAGLADGVKWSLALGRLRHEPRFLVHRVLIGALLRELAVQNVLVDLARGVPAVFVDFVGFDETAHRRGPDSTAAMRELERADVALAAIFAGADAAPDLGYDVYVMSDHGNVATQPFEALAGASLPEFVARAERGDRLPLAPRASHHRGLLGGRTGRAARVDGIATAEAGDLAHVYFLHDRGPLPLDEVRARHWRVLAALSASRAIGVMGARGGRRGFAVVRGAPLDLADPSDVARLPHPEPELLAAYLSDLLSIPESGDLVVLGWRGEGRDVVAYAWEFGSHGGVAPEEIASFVVHPAHCAYPFASALRPSELFGFFERAYRGAAGGGTEAPAADATFGGGGRDAARPE